MNWISLFATFVPSGVSQGNRHLLIFDGHGIHIALQIVEEANMMGIDLLPFPAHTTRGLYSFDVSVFGSFKSYFRFERASWMEKNPGIKEK